MPLWGFENLPEVDYMSINGYGMRFGSRHDTLHVVVIKMQPDGSCGGFPHVFPSELAAVTLSWL